MMTEISSNRWGGFELLPGPSSSSAPIESLGPAKDFPWPEDAGPWEHPWALLHQTLESARADRRCPLPEFMPQGEEFNSAVVIAKDGLVADAAVAFLRKSHPDVSMFGNPDRQSARQADRSVLVAYSQRFGQPASVIWHEGPMPIDAQTMDDATVVEDAIRKVTIRGHEGILRIWRGTNQSLYGARIPSVIINWHDGSLTWTVQSTFVVPEEAIAIAESIRALEV